MKKLFSRLNTNDRQAIVLVGVNGFFWFAWAFGCYQTVYLQSVGFSASTLGVLNAISSAVGIASVTFWGMVSDRTGSLRRVLTMVLAIVALIVAVKATGTERAEETAGPAATVTASVGADLLTTEPVEVIGPWEFAAMYRAAEDPAEKQRIGEALEAQGYFSAAVPLSWEYQDYMRTYCHLYGCPYPLALAVADWETRGQFNMDAIGPAGEVGIMQLNPGPDGSYHAELEAATGLDPTTPEGNIAGGCYKLGKYLAEYGDVAMVAMAYNRGQAGARAAWEAGITSNSYTDAVLEALERWECAVNAWAGE